MVLEDSDVQVTICCVTYWTDMRIILVTSECRCKPSQQGLLFC